MENAAARDLIARMLGVVEHRGPDDEGITSSRASQ